jgi:Domain of unknown function (DUF4272)
MRVSDEQQTGGGNQVKAMPQLEDAQPVAADSRDSVARQRKRRSELIMLSEGVPINPALPPMDFSVDLAPRRKQDVALRALCVLMTAIKADRMHQTMVLRVVRQYGLAAYFSPCEKNFIRDLNPPDVAKMQFSWRYESAWVLLWALGYVDKLESPGRRCDSDFAVESMREKTRQSFIAEAGLRPLEQILDQADLAYRYHCSLVETATENENSPVNLNAPIVFERHHAFNWLIRYSDRDWDETAADEA